MVATGGGSMTEKRGRGRPRKDDGEKEKAAISVPGKDVSSKVADLARAAGMSVPDWLTKIGFVTYVYVKHAEMMEAKSKESKAGLDSLKKRFPPLGLDN